MCPGIRRSTLLLERNAGTILGSQSGALSAPTALAPPLTPAGPLVLAVLHSTDTAAATKVAAYGDSAACVCQCFCWMVCVYKGAAEGRGRRGLPPPSCRTATNKG